MCFLRQAFSRNYSPVRPHTHTPQSRMLVVKGDRAWLILRCREVTFASPLYLKSFSPFERQMERQEVSEQEAMGAIMVIMTQSGVE